MGEGGAIVLNEAKYLERAEIIREKGTNRRQVLKGWTDKYTWHDIGSSFLPSDLLAAVLSAQLERWDEIMQKRLAVWNTYHEALKPLMGICITLFCQMMRCAQGWLMSLRSKKLWLISVMFRYIQRLWA